MMNRPMLLVSVRDAVEAEAALSGGADWIDLKEPRSGPLGAVDETSARSVADRIPSHVPLSAACGELREWPHASARQLLMVRRIEYLKLGLAQCANRADWRQAWRSARDTVAEAGKALVAVAYADARAASAPPWRQVMDLAIEEKAPFVLIDTFTKTSPRSPNGAHESQDPHHARDATAQNLLDLIEPKILADALRSARAEGVQTVLAGSLTEQSLAALPLDWVDIVAVRGAVCARDRCGQVDRVRVAELSQALRPTRIVL